MHGKYSSLLGAVVVTGTISGCSNSMLAPESSTGDELSARLVRISNTIVEAETTDSSLFFGDSAFTKVVVRDRRTGRDVTSSVRVTYSSTDTTDATVDKFGVVRAVGTGSPMLIVRSGQSADTVQLATGQTALPGGIVSLPGTPDEPGLPPGDTQPTPPPVVLPPPPTTGQPSFVTPMLPAASVDTRMPAVTRTIRVAAGDMAALQNAVNTARAGDEIILPNGSLFRGNLTMPRKTGGYTILRSESVPVSAGTRITPSTGANLATIETVNTEAAILFGAGASGWRLVGLRVQMGGSPVDNYGILRMGMGNENSFADLPTDIIVDRSIVQGHPTVGTSRCVGLNGNNLAVIDSWLADCHARGRDAQGIGGWNGAGPFLIENNHIEGSGQAVMFGGADPAVANLTPSDITIRRNHFYKPTSWSGRWTVKAAFELKHARRTLFEGNVIENHWADAQIGFAILFQAVSQDNHAPWTKIWDVTVRNNVIKNSTAGINVYSRFAGAGWIPIEPSKRILFQNNLFENVGRDPITGAAGRLVQILSDLEDVSILNNTFFGATGTVITMMEGAPMQRLTIWNNVFAATEYGLMGSGTAEGNGTLATFAPGASVGGNVFTGRTESRYPTGNAFPASLTSADFVSPSSGDYTLRSSLPFASHNGAQVGVNHTQLSAATAGATR
jgi:hypothetical protein